MTELSQPPKRCQCSTKGETDADARSERLIELHAVIAAVVRATTIGDPVSKDRLITELTAAVMGRVEELAAERETRVRERTLAEIAAMTPPEGTVCPPGQVDIHPLVLAKGVRALRDHVTDGAESYVAQEVAEAMLPTLAVAMERQVRADERAKVVAEITRIRDDVRDLTNAASELSSVDALNWAVEIARGGS